jgi:diguanylate cyclase (GGDEF)-like protein
VSTFSRPDARFPAETGGPEEAWFERVARLSLDLITVFDEERLLKRIVQTFAEAARVRKGSLMLRDESGERLEIRAALGVSEQAWTAVRPRIGEGAAGWVAKTGKPLLVIDTTDPACPYVDFAHRKGQSRLQESMLSLPLVYREEVMGVMNLEQKVSGDAFQERDISRLQVLCNFAAVALTNLRLYHAAVTDGLTGLLGQKAFLKYLEEEFSRSRRYKAPLSLIYLDLDHFKKFNDTYGHPLGDQALRHLAGILREATRNVDTVGRCGGEEFGVILTETDLPAAEVVAERIRSRLEKTPLHAGGKDYTLTASLGIACVEPEETDMTPDKLRQEADQALYRAKAAGRNRVAV